jgi:hypothetical protein
MLQTSRTLQKPFNGSVRRAEMPGSQIKTGGFIVDVPQAMVRDSVRLHMTTVRPERSSCCRNRCPGFLVLVWHSMWHSQIMASRNVRICVCVLINTHEDIRAGCGLIRTNCPTGASRVRSRSVYIIVLVLSAAVALLVLLLLLAAGLR